ELHLADLGHRHQPLLRTRVPPIPVPGPVPVPVAMAVAVAVAVGARARKHRDLRSTHAFDLGDDLLDVLRVVVAPAQDDDVLAAPANVELAVREVAEVAGEELPIAKRGAGGRLVAEVTPGDA